MLECALESEKLPVQPVDGISPLLLPCLLGFRLCLQLVSLDFQTGELLPHFVQLAFNLDLLLIVFTASVKLPSLKHVFLDLELLQARSRIVQLFGAVGEFGLSFAHFGLQLDLLQLGFAQLILLLEKVVLNRFELRFFELELFRELLHLI